jgi:AraC-like DNA-binding protein
MIVHPDKFEWEPDDFEFEQPIQTDTEPYSRPALRPTDAEQLQYHLQHGKGDVLVEDEQDGLYSFYRGPGGVSVERYAAGGNFHAILRKSDYGVGWWHNLATGKTHEMHPDSMGAAGDHDGYLTIGDHAEGIGIPRHEAVAFQAAQYGFPDPGEFGKEAAESRMTVPDNTGKEVGLVESSIHWHDPKFVAKFRKRFGMKPEEAMKAMSKWPLIRARLWKNGLLTIDSEYNKVPWHVVHDIRSRIPSGVVKRAVVMSAGQWHYATGPEFEAAHSYRDFLKERYKKAK